MLYMHKSLLAQYFTNCLLEYCQIYNCSGIGDKDELIRILGQRSESQRDEI